ncbi:hypothetical protein L6Q21_03745 [Sandaracinobacter sp. RS1-74]|uniref:hypothetical protein n=1 Tax=Sandaracinobacteroides sayramensis TaxID=2913411 RepID=UPI001EDA4C37|nr:hypothetical protein [Sandaracinobacteroides sayramensis]MCG2840098.1 hypothetical protein [Sandaracinobacteroides sayramensis]
MFNSPFIVPVVAMMIPIIAIIMKNWRQVQNRKLDLMEKSTSELTNVAQARIEKLEARVAVLERIATDKRLALADEIDALGHQGLSQARPRLDQ